MMYGSPGVGSPILFCDVCGCRVQREVCELHDRPAGDYIGLHDKAIAMHIVRLTSLVVGLSAGRRVEADAAALAALESK